MLGAIGLALLTLNIQLGGAWYTGSLALLGDSAHVFTDLFSLAMSLAAVLLAARPASPWRSFGFYRLEVLASFVNGLLLLLVSLGLAREGVARLLGSAEPVKTGPLLAIAAVGLLLNLGAAWLLHRASHDGHGHAGHGHADHKGENHSHLHADRNLESALLHVWSDAMGSVAVIVGAIAIRLTEQHWIDAAVGLALALWIFRWAWRVILDAGHVLLESTPRHISTERLVSGLRELDSRVEKVDDLHVWELTSRMYAATAEVRVRGLSMEEAERLRRDMHRLMQEEYGIAHVVLAIRPA